jgi:hypothetical protein
MFEARRNTKMNQTRNTNPPLRRRVIEEYGLPDDNLAGDNGDVGDHDAGGCARPLGSNRPDPTNDNE